MYKQNINESQRERLRRGDIQLLITLLEASDTQLIRELKRNKEDTRFLQGAALVIDKLIRILKKSA